MMVDERLSWWARRRHRQARYLQHDADADLSDDAPASRPFSSPRPRPCRVKFCPGQARLRVASILALRPKQLPRPAVAVLLRLPPPAAACAAPPALVFLLLPLPAAAGAAPPAHVFLRLPPPAAACAAPPAHVFLRLPPPAAVLRSPPPPFRLGCSIPLRPYLPRRPKGVPVFPVLGSSLTSQFGMPCVRVLKPPPSTQYLYPTYPATSPGRSATPNKTPRGNKHELSVEPQAALQGLRALSIAVTRSECQSPGYRV